MRCQPVSTPDRRISCVSDVGGVDLVFSHYLGNDALNMNRLPAHVRHEAMGAERPPLPVIDDKHRLDLPAVTSHEDLKVDGPNAKGSDASCS